MTVFILEKSTSTPCFSHRVIKAFLLPTLFLQNPFTPSSCPPPRPLGPQSSSNTSHICILIKSIYMVSFSYLCSHAHNSCFYPQVFEHSSCDFSHYFPLLWARCGTCISHLRKASLTGPQTDSSGVWSFLFLSKSFLNWPSSLYAATSPCL